MQAVTDEQLIERVAGGDLSCLGSLFERHHRGVYQYCRQMTRDSMQAEDLVQDVFVKILRKAGSFRQQGSFKAWMFNIARNTALDHFRKTSRHCSEAPEPVMMEEHQVDHRTAEDVVAARQDVQTVAQAMATLPAMVREVIWLGRFEFDNYEELGVALNCKPATARVRMHRAMQQLHVACEAITGVPLDV